MMMMTATAWMRHPRRVAGKPRVHRLRDPPGSHGEGADDIHRNRFVKTSAGSVAECCKRPGPGQLAVANRSCQDRGELSSIPPPSGGTVPIVGVQKEFPCGDLYIPGLQISPRLGSMMKREREKNGESVHVYEVFFFFFFQPNDGGEREGRGGGWGVVVEGKRSRIGMD